MKLLLILLSLSSTAWAEDCSQLLSSYERVVISIRDLAKLRVDLDLQNALGSQTFVNQLLEKNYQTKKNELALLEPQLEQKLKKEIDLIQKLEQKERRALQKQGAVQKKHQDDAKLDLKTIGKIKTDQSGEEAVMLSNGEIVFLTAAFNISTPTNTPVVQIFNPVDGTARDSVSLEENLTYYGHSKLKDDIILISGGDVSDPYKNASSLSTIRYFDPLAGIYKVVGKLKKARTHHTQVTLSDGRVMMLGGFYKTKAGNKDVLEVEIYDPGTQTSEILAKFKVAVGMTRAELLPDGNVITSNGKQVYLIDILNRKIKLIGSLHEERRWFAHSVLPDGRWVITGGYEGGAALGIEVVDPKLKTITHLAERLGEERYNGRQITLDDGRVLIVGGSDHSGAVGRVKPMLIFDPQTEEVYPLDIPAMYNRTGHHLVLSKDKTILIIGGHGDNGYVNEVQRLWIGRTP